MKSTLPAIVMSAAVVALSTSTASAQAMRCSAFLHNADGSWSSFYTGDVLGPRGPIPITTGERLRYGDGGAKGAVAHALDRMCTPE